MGMYRCYNCGGMYCSHDVIAWTAPGNASELICDDCHQEFEEIREEAIAEEVAEEAEDDNTGMECPDNGELPSEDAPIADPNDNAGNDRQAMQMFGYYGTY